jgi:hypothetical protein
LILIELKFDSVNLPNNCITNLAASCPNLQGLKLKYANLDSNHFIDICNYFPKLVDLSLGKCEIWFFSPNPSGWDEEMDVSEDDYLRGTYSPSNIHYKELIYYTCNKLRHLQKFHLNQCAILPSRNPHIQNEYTTFLNAPFDHPLKSLKVFDITEGAPTESDILSLMTTLSRLESIRFNSPASLLCSQSSFPSIPESVKKMEFRFSKHNRSDVLMKNFKASLPCSSTLTNLILWSPPNAILLSLLTTHLTHLTLNHISILDNAPKLPTLPYLKHLTLSTLSSTSIHQCQTLLEMFLDPAFAKARLESLKLENYSETIRNSCQALTITSSSSSQTTNTGSSSSSSENSRLKQDHPIFRILESLESLTSLSLIHFQLPARFIGSHTSHWPRLKNFVVDGWSALVAKDKQDIDAFMSSHTSLQALTLNFQELTDENEVGMRGRVNDQWAVESDSVRRKWSGYGLESVILKCSRELTEIN